MMNEWNNEEVLSASSDNMCFVCLLCGKMDALLYILFLKV